MTTVNDWLKSSSLKLKKISTSPFIDAEIILMHVLKISREKIITNPNLIIKNQQLIKLDGLLKKRLRSIPIAYLTNSKSFYGLDFFVNNNVLIPRPDSETIIDLALEIINSLKNPTVVELGVGSGALLLSIVKNYDKTINAIGYDISPTALIVARKNSKLLDINENIIFKKGNLLSGWPANKSIDLIVANLPYLPKNYLAKHKNLSELGLKYEPKISLFSGTDGLDLYRELKKQLATYKVDNLIIEVLPQQITRVKKMFSDHNYVCVAKNDLSGIPRFLIISKIK